MIAILSRVELLLSLQPPSQEDRRALSAPTSAFCVEHFGAANVPPVVVVVLFSAYCYSARALQQDLLCLSSLPRWTPAPHVLSRRLQRFKPLLVWSQGESLKWVRDLPLTDAVLSSCPALARSVVSAVSAGVCATGAHPTANLSGALQSQVSLVCSRFVFFTRFFSRFAGPQRGRALAAFHAFICVCAESLRENVTLEEEAIVQVLCGACVYVQEVISSSLVVPSAHAVGCARQ